MSPCKDCTDRHPLCHSDCERYISYKSTLDIVRKARQDNARFYTTGHQSNMRSRYKKEI